MLIIFDCDGVLVDSETLAAEIFAHQLDQFDIPLSAAECEQRFRGHTLTYCMSQLNRTFPGILPVDFLDQLSEATQRGFAERLQAVEGVEGVLRWLLAKNYPFCVASNGHANKIRHSLKTTGLLAYFEERCFSADSVVEGKPAPDLFLYAARQMGSSAQRSIVVEDSAAGVSAALSAGMKVCLYKTLSSPVDANRVFCFNDMLELPRLLESIIAKHQPT